MAACTTCVLVSTRLQAPSVVCCVSGTHTLQGNPIIICNREDEETKKMAYKSMEIPHCVDALQGILTIIPLQLLSMHIAELRKCDVSYCGVIIFITDFCMWCHSHANTHTHMHTDTHIYSCIENGFAV